MKSKIVPSEILWGRSIKLYEIAQVNLVILEVAVHPRIKKECIPLISGAFYFYFLLIYVECFGVSR